MTLTMEYSSSCSVSKVLLKLELDKAPEFKAAPFEQKSYLSLPHPNNSLPQVCVCVCSCSNQDDDFVCGQQGANEVELDKAPEFKAPIFEQKGVCSCVPARLFGG